MFGKRCTLCGGKLDSQGICRECGLDSHKSERNYRVNQSSCDHLPMTHVHEEEIREVPIRQMQRPMGRAVVPKQKARDAAKMKRGIAILFFVLMLICIGVSVFSAIGGGLRYDIRQMVEGDSQPEGYYEPEDPYAYVEEDLPETGESAEYELIYGHYIVGVDLPAGRYEAEVVSEWDTVQVSDYERGIYLFEYEAKDETNYLDDIRLYEGASVTIMAEDKVILRSDNAQTDKMHGMENPLTKSVPLNSGLVQTAGEDFEEGIYDVVLSTGYGNVRVVRYDDQGNETDTRGVYLGEDGGDSPRYQGLIIPKGAEIQLDEGMSVMLIPSLVIPSTDYETLFYEY